MLPPLAGVHAAEVWPPSVGAIACSVVPPLTADAAGAGPPSAGACTSGRIRLGFPHPVPQQQSHNTA